MLSLRFAKSISYFNVYISAIKQTVLPHRDLNLVISDVIDLICNIKN